MHTKQWMVTLVWAGALCTGAAMAADTGAVNQQPVAKLGQSGAAAGSEIDECPMHSNKGVAQKNTLGKEGEHCSCPHDKMHMHQMKHMSKQDACDPAKEAAKPAKPAS